MIFAARMENAGGKRTLTSEYGKINDKNNFPTQTATGRQAGGGMRRRD